MKERMKEAFYRPDLFCKYGAPMGRGTTEEEFSSLPNRSVRVMRTRLNDAGYDRGGAYYGGPNNLYTAYNADMDIVAEVRAWSRKEAIEKMRIPEEKLKRK